MPSSRDWTDVPSLAHNQSVDSGSETDAFSLINANPEFGDTNYLDLDENRNMALPLGNDQPSSENLPTIRSTVVDWVHEQSQHDQPSKDASGLQRARVEATPSCASQAKRTHARVDDHASRQDGCQPAKKMYDIASLLRLRETQSAVPVMLRVKPEAIAGKCHVI